MMFSKILLIKSYLDLCKSVFSYTSIDVKMYCDNPSAKHSDPISKQKSES